MRNVTKNRDTGEGGSATYEPKRGAQSAGLILTALEDSKEDIRRFGVRRLGLFGSAVRGENTGESDLDFLVEFDRKSFDSYMALKNFLETLLGCQVDLVLADTLKPRLRETILNETVYAPGL